MQWYRVRKRIRGRSYDYWQKTYRVGRSVKTLNKYIGPSTAIFNGGPGGTSFILKEDGTHMVPSQPNLSDEALIKEKAAAERFLTAAPGIPDPNDIRHISHGEKAIAYNHAKPAEIVRMKDLPPKKQKEHMKESMRRIKADKRKANPESERAVMYFCRKCDHMTFSTGWEGHCRCGNTTYYVKK